MLVDTAEKSEPGDILVINLINGLEVLATFKEKHDNVLVVTHPRRLVQLGAQPGGQPQLGLSHYSVMADDEKTTQFRKENIASISYANNEIAAEYKSSTSEVITPPKQKIITK